MYAVILENIWNTEIEVQHGGGPSLLPLRVIHCQHYGVLSASVFTEIFENIIVINYTRSLVICSFLAPSSETSIFFMFLQTPGKHHFNGCVIWIVFSIFIAFLFYLLPAASECSHFCQS